MGVAIAVFFNTGNAPEDAEETDNFKPIDFGAVVDTEFTARDNQSALSAQQVTISSLERKIKDLTQTVTSQIDSNDTLRKAVSQERKEMANTLHSFGLPSKKPWPKTASQIPHKQRRTRRHR